MDDMDDTAHYLGCRNQPDSIDAVRQFHFVRNYH